MLSGMTYWLWFKVVTNVGQVYRSPRVAFPVRYADVSVGMAPTAENDEDNSNVIVKWSSLIENIGKVIGDYSFVKYLTDENYGLYLHSGSSLEYDELKVNAGNSSVPTFMWTPKESTFDGVIMKADNTLTGEFLEIGYDASVQCFWFSIDGGDKRYNAVQRIYPNLSYMIGMAGSELIVNVVGNVEVEWNE